MQTKLSIEIEATPETVFKWIVEPECVKQWLPNIAEYEFSDGGVASVGTHLVQTWHDDGQETQFEGEITGYDLNKHFEIYLENKNTQVNVAYSLTKSGNGTKLTQDTNITYTGMMKMIDKVAAPAIQKSYTDQSKQNFLRLIDLCTGS